MDAVPRPTADLAAARGRAGVRPALSTTQRVGSVAAYFVDVYRRVWQGSIIGRFLSPLLFLLSMGLGLGSLVDRSSGGVDGHTYLQFVVPALVANQAMWVAMGESTYQVMGYIKWNRMYEAMLATPLSVRDVLTGHLLTVAGHLTVASTIFVGVAALFGGFASWWALLGIPLGVLTGLAFAIPVFGYTARQEDEDGFNILYRLVVTPLMLFSGTFFPVEQLPALLRPVAWVTPLWHGVESSRAAAFGQPFTWAVALHVLVLLGFVGAGWVWALRGFTRRLVT